MTPANFSDVKSAYSAIVIKDISGLCADNVLTIAESARLYGEDAVRILLCDSIARMNAFFDIKKPMTPLQVEMTASLIIEKFPNLGLDGLKLFFKQALCGDFGPTYGSMDGQKIIIWMQQFYKQYWNALYDIKENEHEARKEAEKEYILPNEETQKIINFLCGDGRKTDKEIENELRVKEIRQKIINENKDYLSSLSEDEGIKFLNQKINAAITANNSN